LVEGEVGNDWREAEFLPTFDRVKIHGDRLPGVFVDEASTVFGEEGEG
jgi:hypothetical protein